MKFVGRHGDRPLEPMMFDTTRKEYITFLSATYLMILVLSCNSGLQKLLNDLTDILG